MNGRMGFLDSAIAWMHRNSASAARLEATLANEGPKIARRMQGREDEPWARQAAACMAQAHQFYGRGLIDSAWRSLAAAWEATVEVWDEHELQAQSATLETERKKFADWRRDAVGGLLEPPLTWQKVQQALWLRNDHFHGTYHKIAQLRSQMTLLVSLSFLAILLFGLIVAGSGLSMTQWPAWSIERLGAAMLFGVLGAGFSAAQSLMKSPGQGTVPERMAQTSVTLGRVLFGSVAGLVACVALESQVISLGEATIGKVLLVSFSSGISERLITSVVQKSEEKAGGK